MTNEPAPVHADPNPLLTDEDMETATVEDVVSALAHLNDRWARAPEEPVAVRELREMYQAALDRKRLERWRRA